MPPHDGVGAPPHQCPLEVALCSGIMLTCAVTMTRNNEGEKAEEWKSPENSYVPQTYFYAQREEVSYAKFHSFLYTYIHKYIFSYIRYTYLQTYIYIQLV